MFDLNTSKRLSYTVFYYVGKVFGVRGASEYHQLESEQFSFLADEQESYVQFEERRVETNQGGISQKSYAPRKVHHYEVEGDTCVYKILLKYLSFINFTGKLYRRPLPSHNSEIKFANTHIGRHKLGSYMQSMFAEAGIRTERQRFPTTQHACRKSLRY